MNHSIRGYLERQPTEQLENFLQWCKEEQKEDEYAYSIPIILEILEKRKQSNKKN